jgi:TrmH family RNA methyltransferase
MKGWGDPKLWPVASQRRLAEWRKLTTKKGRDQTGMLLIEGVRLVGDALRSGQSVTALLVADDEQGVTAIDHLAAVVSRPAVELLRLPRREFDRLANTVHAAGIAALLHWQPPALITGQGPSVADRRVLIGDHLADPGNLGTLIRTAAGLGVDRVIITSGSVELTNPKTVRAAAGALFRIPIHGDIPAAQAAAWCEEHRLSILVADAHRGSTLGARHLWPRWALVVGGETIPHDPIWTSVAAGRVHIPLRHGVESLNAALAGAILIDRLCRTDPPPKSRQRR